MGQHTGQWAYNHFFLKTCVYNKPGLCLIGDLAL